MGDIDPSNEREINGMSRSGLFSLVDDDLSKIDRAAITTAIQQNRFSNNSTNSDEDLEQTGNISGNHTSNDFPRNGKKMTVVALIYRLNQIKPQFFHCLKG